LIIASFPGYQHCVASAGLSLAVPALKESMKQGAAQSQLNDLSRGQGRLAERNENPARGHAPIPHKGNCVDTDRLQQADKAWQWPLSERQYASHQSVAGARTRFAATGVTAAWSSGTCIEKQWRQSLRIVCTVQ
jgi:hypothetical protein